jgi:hypothetical protein
VCKFYQTLCRRRNSASAEDPFFIQRHVRTLFIISGCPEAQEIIEIIQHLTKLQSLACWDGDETEWGRTGVRVLLDSVRNGGDNFPFAHLRRISFSTSVLEERNVTFAHRAFRDLTHVDFVVHSTVEWSSLRSLQNLTHASFDLATDLPGLTTKEMQSWFSRLLAACPSTVKIIIFAIVEDYIADFDLRDFEGDYLYPGWPPPPSEHATTESECCMTPLRSCISESCSDIDLEILHPLARIALGILDPRVVPGTMTSNIDATQIYRNLLVYCNMSNYIKDWDGTVPRHRDCWTSAEDIISRRKVRTWAELVAPTT